MLGDVDPLAVFAAGEVAGLRFVRLAGDASVVNQHVARRFGLGLSP
jgi:hypothetical protein